MLWHCHGRHFNNYGYRRELNKLYLSKDLICGFATDYYWSSPEHNNSHAWRQDLDSGAQSNTVKYSVLPRKGDQGFLTIVKQNGFTW